MVGAIIATILLVALTFGGVAFMCCTGILVSGRGTGQKADPGHILLRCRDCGEVIQVRRLPRLGGTD
jgi:hypothetical protein